MEINIRLLFLTILFALLIEPDFFASITAIHIVYVGMRYIAVFMGIIYCLKMRQIPKITLLLIGYFLIYGYSTIFNNGNLFNLLNYSMSIISLVLWIEISLKNNPLRGLQSLNIVFSFLVYLNLLFVLIFPDGYAQGFTYRGESVERYFLGVYNQFAATLIPALIINITYVYMRYGKIRNQTILLLFAVMITFTYFWSATSLVGLALIIIYLLLIEKTLFRRLIKRKTLIITMVGLYLIVVILDLVKIFSFIVEDLLNKDVTLSTRTIIWDAAIDMIKQAPLLGYGYLGDGARYIVFSAVNEKDSHNTGLQLMLQHGIIGCIPLIILLFIYLKKLGTNNSHKISKFILYSLFVASTMMLTEVYAFRYLLIVLLLGIFSPYIIEQNKSEIRNRYDKQIIKK